MPFFEIKHNVVTKTGDKDRIVKVCFEVEADTFEEATERVRSTCGRLFRRSGGDALQYKGEAFQVSINGEFTTAVEVSQVFEPGQVFIAINPDTPES